MSEIEENNKLIAEFLEWDYDELNERYTSIYLICLKEEYWNSSEDDWTSSVLPEEMKFHICWDWLMPVFEKIMDICLNYENDYGDFYGIRDCIPNISQTYKAIVEFIIMYNENKK